MTDTSETTVLARVRAELAQKTKPAGSLDRLDEMVLRLAKAQRTDAPQVMPSVALIFASDHGISRDGVSAYPREVTAQMVHNIATGGAAVCAFANACGATVSVFDVGVDSPAFEAPVRDVKIARGTHNIRHRAAMSAENLERALQIGADALDDAVEQGARSVIIGEMGIGNTAASSAVAAALLQTSAAAMVGPGTGVAGEALAAKIRMVDEALARAHAPASPQEALRELGGFELAAITGVCLRARARHCAVIVDGFISSVAALCAVRIDPRVEDQLFWGHRSSEPGHDRILAELDAQPILDLQMRLGEGSGAMLALPILHAACTMMAQMQTFDAAGVSNRGDNE